MARRMQKPIRIFYSLLTGSFYATRSYKILTDGMVLCTGEKFDVTQDIARLIVENGITFTEKKSDDARAVR